VAKKAEGDGRAGVESVGEGFTSKACGGEKRGGKDAGAKKNVRKVGKTARQLPIRGGATNREGNRRGRKGEYAAQRH